MNRIKEAFGEIKAEDELKQRTYDFIENQRSKNFKPKNNLLKYSLAAAAVIILTFAGGIYEMWFVPVTVISIDVNPSVEIEVNRLDRILSSNAYNDDGTKILQSVSMNGKKYEDTISTLLQDDEFNRYLNDDALLTFTVASKNQDTVISQINGCLNSSGHSGVCVEASSEAVSEAHSLGLSLGKYHAYLEILKYDETITPEECQSMTMKELNELKRQLSQETSGTNSQTGQHHGNGKQNHGQNNQNR